jgi:isoleucyl-tRNA synthetase
MVYDEGEHMKFKANSRRKAIEYEKDLVRQWKEQKTFEKSVENRSKDNAYVFYDGPPFITGVPHHGTLLTSVVKDAVPRYWTMRGKRVERVWGWDTHGLPAENFVEKKLGITDRHDIGTKISLEEYITTARESMIQTGNLWESLVDRIGRWVDFQGAYKTMDKDYMESVWWAFKELYDKGKIYEGERVLMYDTKWATPLSKAEVTMDAGAYQVVTDPSVYVKFKLLDKFKAVGDEKGDPTKPVYLLAWTTTPWTLPGNTAIAINKESSYDEVEINGERLIIASDRIAAVLTDEKHNPLDYEVMRMIRGEELIGLSYEPLFEDRGQNAHKVWHADYVRTDVADAHGSGIVHLAPTYGEEDFDLAKKYDIPQVHVLDEYGNYTEGEWVGENVWEINKTIAKTLKERGTVWKIDYIQHEYPHNLRNGNRLMYRAHPSWFMDIAGQKELMLEQNAEVNWFPEHIKHGRSEKTIETAPDWNLSRDRFWATAMPVWKGTDSDGEEHIKVVGSYAELKELSGVELDDYHRPWVDDIEFDLDGVHYQRIDKVLDCWFESGSMPFAQFHYPFENKEKFEANFPGDFIVEYVSQVRAWFYYMNAVNVGLFGKVPFKMALVHGTMLGSDGRKLSKSLGNFTDPNEVMDLYSADALRFLFLSSNLLNGEDFTLKDKDVQDVQRKLAMIWNMYDFFTMYAEVDDWEWQGKHEDPSKELTNSLDLWVVSRLHQLQQQITEHMDTYDIPGALEGVLPFLDDASNWYVRRSRRRFWKSGDDSDKNDAYRTLHYVLVRLSIILAPFVPFLAEELYQKLAGGESVHLLDWPKVGAIDESIIERMDMVRQYIETGLRQRAEHGVKVRQPLAKVDISVYTKDWLDDDLLSIIQDELNVKNVMQTQTATNDVKDLSQLLTIDWEITPELKREGMMRELIRQIQTARKSAGLNVDDRIALSIVSTDDEVKLMLQEYADTITSETLATSFNAGKPEQYSADLTVDGYPVNLSLSKLT